MVFYVGWVVFLWWHRKLLRLGSSVFQLPGIGSYIALAIAERRHACDRVCDCYDDIGDFIV